jgi:hypothetical protein
MILSLHDDPKNFVRPPGSARGPAERRRRHRGVALAGLAGGAAALAVALRALEVHDLGEALDVFTFRTGRVPGLWALGLAVLGIAAGALAPARLAWSASMASVAGVGGFLAVGSLWFLPGALLMAAGVWAFALVEDPGGARRAEDAGGA